MFDLLETFTVHLKQIRGMNLTTELLFFNLHYVFVFFLYTC